MRGFSKQQVLNQNYINLFAAIKLCRLVIFQTDFLHKRTAFILQKKKNLREVFVLLYSITAGKTQLEMQDMYKE